MLKSLILILLIGLLVGGCVNQSEELCLLIGESVNNTITAEYKVNTCIVEEENFNHITSVKCVTGRYYMNLLAKTKTPYNESEMGFDKSCKVEVLR